MDENEVMAKRGKDDSLASRLNVEIFTESKFSVVDSAVQPRSRTADVEVKERKQLQGVSGQRVSILVYTQQYDTDM